MIPILGNSKRARRVLVVGLALTLFLAGFSWRRWFSKWQPSHDAVSLAAEYAPQSTMSSLKWVCGPRLVAAETDAKILALYLHLVLGDGAGGLSTITSIVELVARKRHGDAKLLEETLSYMRILLLEDTDRASYDGIAPPEDALAHLSELRATIGRFGLAPNIAAALLLPIGEAEDAFEEGDRERALVSLARVVSMAVSFRIDGEPQLTGEQSYVVVREAIEGMLWFDPVPLVVTFRDGFATEDLPKALSAVVSFERENIGRRYGHFFSPAQRANMENVISTNLKRSIEPRATWVNYDMYSPGQPVFALGFRPDCDGKWRISSY